MVAMPKDPRGRKPRDGAAASNVSVRLSTDERAAYEAAAARNSLTLGEWIRKCCQAALPRKRASTPPR